MDRNIYFHNLAEDSRSLEILLHTCHDMGFEPIIASKGHGKKLAYIVFTLNTNYLNTVGRLIDLTLEIPNSEFNIKSHKGKLYVELSCDSKDNDQLFTRIKEIIEEAKIDKETHNLTLMNTIYNITKIINDSLNADILFATDETLYSQGKCGISIYKDKITKIKSKNKCDILEVIKTLKEKAMINLPTIFICSFEELRNFYFELDETVYGDDLNE